MVLAALIDFFRSLFKLKQVAMQKIDPVNDDERAWIAESIQNAHKIVSDTRPTTKTMFCPSTRWIVPSRRIVKRQTVPMEQRSTR